MQSSVGASVSGGVGSASGSHVSPAPSKVLHIRGLPPYTSESDVLSFFASLPAQAGGSAGGSSLTRILLLPNSNQAFLQLASVEQAINLVALQAAQGGHFVLKGNKSIIVQFSNRQEIHTPATLAAAAGGGAGAGAGGPAQAQHAHADYAKTGGVGGGNDSQQTANSILIVTVLNTRVPVTLDHIHQIFKVTHTYHTQASRTSLALCCRMRTGTAAHGPLRVGCSIHRSQGSSALASVASLLAESRAHCSSPVSDCV